MDERQQAIALLAQCRHHHRDMDQPVLQARRQGEQVRTGGASNVSVWRTAPVDEWIVRQVDQVRTRRCDMPGHDAETHVPPPQVALDARTAACWYAVGTQHSYRIEICNMFNLLRRDLGRPWPMTALAPLPDCDLGSGSPVRQQGNQRSGIAEVRRPGSADESAKPARH
jgi:hypothetical protein